MQSCLFPRIEIPIQKRPNLTSTRNSKNSEKKNKNPPTRKVQSSKFNPSIPRLLFSPYMASHWQLHLFHKKKKNSNNNRISHQSNLHVTLAGSPPTTTTSIFCQSLPKKYYRYSNQRKGWGFLAPKIHTVNLWSTSSCKWDR